MNLLSLVSFGRASRSTNCEPLQVFRQNRRKLLRILGLAITGVTTAIWMRTGSGQTPGAEVPDLRETLKAGLKARLPAEHQFIERVVTMVEQKQLPMALVQSTFQWARKKARYKPYPFPYFERGLRLRAANQGIRIP